MIPDGFVKAEAHWHRRCIGIRIFYQHVEDHLAGSMNDVRFPFKMLEALQKRALVPASAQVIGFYHEPYMAAVVLRVHDVSYEEPPFNTRIPVYDLEVTGPDAFKLEKTSIV